jgi:hypothetical protein
MNPHGSGMYSIVTSSYAAYNPAFIDIRQNMGKLRGAHNWISGPAFQGNYSRNESRRTNNLPGKAMTGFEVMQAEE